MLADPYAFGVLKPEHHERLVADLDNYAMDAGIQPRWIYSHLPDTVSQDEIEYLKGFRRHKANGIAGMALVGKNEHGRVETHMAAFAGFLVRNFIRARVMTLGTVLDMLPKQEMPELSCLLVPNFFLASSEGGTIAPWQVNLLFDYLTYRQVAGLQTIVYVSDIGLLGKEYGLAFRRLIDGSYARANV